MSNRSPYDVSASNECSECSGRGYPFSTSQVIRTINNAPVTVELGYGCLTCLGIGRLVEE